MIPKILNDPLYQLLREGKVKDFNDRRALGESIDLTNCDFRNVDLRGLDAKGLDLRGSYFRQADLRGVDLSEAQLEGASINGAHISGTYFPKNLSANEILLSFQHGTRMRYSS
ncbi:pentapeptide repeat-containing protein [Nitrospira sp. M1]